MSKKTLALIIIINLISVGLLTFSIVVFVKYGGSDSDKSSVDTTSEYAISDDFTPPWGRADESESELTAAATVEAVPEGTAATEEALKEADSEETIEATAEKSFFVDMPDNYAFSSGAGGWGTGVTINDDGTFVGSYHDSDMGVTGDGYPNGTMSICNFWGELTEPVKINDYTYSCHIKSIDQTETEGEEWIEDGVRYVGSIPYGFDNADEILIYTKGAPISELPEEFMVWVRTWYYYDNPDATELPFYGLYNVNQAEGFAGER